MLWNAWHSRRHRSRVSRAMETAQADLARSSNVRPFSRGTRPVIRWVKGNGLDDVVTRAAIGAATRLFGSDVDYCLCTNGIDAERVRSVLAWATEPVEWWPQSAGDNPDLARRLNIARCPSDRFGYWWKWFPERVRPDAPEWVLDGDMVLVDRPEWFQSWVHGQDRCRISSDDARRYPQMYGRYAPLVVDATSIYSGLVSLPPGFRYMPEFLDILDRHPLRSPHDGVLDMCEQGVVALAFSRLDSATFPLSEFPFARAMDDELDFGLPGDRGRPWGYHFGQAFRMPNPHFERMVEAGIIHSPDPPTVQERFAWLGNFGQWGIPGWTMTEPCTEFVLDCVQRSGVQEVLEFGTSRGRLTAMLCASGIRVRTVDHIDRGASVNLAGLPATVIVADALDYLRGSSEEFAFIVVDVHGNSEEVWQALFPALHDHLAPDGYLLLSNAELWRINEWRQESGVRWVLRHLPANMSVVASTSDAPGAVLLRRSAR